MDIFSTPESLSRIYRSGLESLLDQPEVTPDHLFIALSNAVQLGDRPLLGQTMALIKRLPASAASADDYAALQLALATPDPLTLVHQRVTSGGHVIQFNELRAHRPQRESAIHSTSIHRPFEPNKFNFNSIPHETYFKGHWDGRKYSLYFNKYPFMPYHTSVVPEPEVGHEQFLTPRQYDFVRWFVRELAVSHPGLSLAYNSLGAYASINHLHFHLVPDNTALPLFDPKQGTFHTAVERHTSAASAWAQISSLQSSNHPFNIVITAHSTYVIPRLLQGTYRQPSWTTGFAWVELTGLIVVSDRHIYDTLTDAQIIAALRQVRPKRLATASD
jgi:diadenosine tetraphosphate (Ap4A) HIT family hydrolase